MQEKVHFHNLDVLRFICAIGVALAHSYEGYFGWIGTPDLFQQNPAVKQVTDVFMGNLSLGVNMFFVISGFLITYLLLTEKERYGNIHVGKFIVRRSLRIWPLYYLAIGFGALLVMAYPEAKRPDFLPTLLFWNNFHMISIREWQFPFAHFWSICVEEHFYLVWPLIVFLLPLKRVLPVSLLLIGGSIAFRYILVTYMHTDDPQLHLHMNTLCRIDEILVGAFIACIHHAKPIVLKIHIAVRAIVYALFVAVVCTFPQNDFWIWGIWSVLFKKYLYLFFIVFWLLNYLFNPNAFFNFKKKNLLHYFGKISFGIYIYHNMVIPVFIKYFAYKWGIKSMPLYFAGYIIFVLLISVISFECYEKFFLKLKDKFALVKTQR